MSKKIGRSNATGIDVTTAFKKQYNSILTTASNKMGDHNTRSLGHLDTSIGQTSVQKRAFLDPNPVFVQRIEHRRQASEIEIFLLESQMYMHHFYLLFLHTI